MVHWRCRTCQHCLSKIKRNLITGSMIFGAEDSMTYNCLYWELVNNMERDRAVKGLRCSHYKMTEEGVVEHIEEKIW